MRALVLNHTYGQDLDSLRYAAGEDVEFRELPLAVLHREAMRVLPNDIDDGPEFYSKPEYEPARRELAGVLRRLFESLFRERAFDLFVSPSDVFYYLRPAPEALRPLGVPYFVAERETTVSPHIMDQNIALMRRWFPPIAQHRTLCSDRLREFWVSAGAPAESVTVTGQPRFDFYRQPERWPRELPYGEAGPTVLFLSYDYNAYHPDGETEADVWEKQHRETEQGLFELARRGWRVLYKPHPQQQRRDGARVRQEAGGLLNEQIFILSPDTDTRELVVSSDVVVGFQTTALFEAMAAQKPIVYAGWDASDGHAADALIPFRQWPDVLELVDRPEDFVGTVERAREQRWDERRVEAARAPMEANIGVCDGEAARRTLDAMERCVASRRAEWTSEVEAHRARLGRQPPPLDLRRRAHWGYVRARRRAGAVLGR